MATMTELSVKTFCRIGQMNSSSVFLCHCSGKSSLTGSGSPVTGVFFFFLRYGTILAMSKTWPSVVQTGSSNGRSESEQQ